MTTHAADEAPEEPPNGSSVVARWGNRAAVLWRRDDAAAAFYVGPGDVDPNNPPRWLLMYVNGQESFPMPWRTVLASPPESMTRRFGDQLDERPTLMLCVPVGEAPAAAGVDLDRVDDEYLYPDGPGTLPEVVGVRAVELVKRAREEAAALRETLDRVAELAAAPAGYDGNGAAYVVADDLAAVLGPAASWRRSDPRMLARYARHLAYAATRLGRALPDDRSNTVASAVERLYEASDVLDQLPPIGAAKHREGA